MNTHLPPPTTTSNNNPYVHYSSVHVSSSSGNRPMIKVFGMFNRCGKRVEDATKKAEIIADNVWHHFKLSRSFTDAAMARLAQGTKVLTEGGQEKVFDQTFQNLPGEKLLNSYICYLSTSSGPVIGTLYISNKKIAFCSDSPLCYYSSTGNPEWVHYKVVIQIEKVRSVNPASNRLNPSEKYIHIVTRDDHEFWFMGFISYDKALNNLTQALHLSPADHNSVPVHLLT